MTLDSVFNDDWDAETHRSGVVAVVGRPNVGKSTLINAILGQKIAITTPKPQTTRRNQLGIYTVENGQILFTDTPGIHKPHNSLGEYMSTSVQNALRDADAILWIIDVSEAPYSSDEYIAEIMQKQVGKTPIVLVLNKIDLVDNKRDFSQHTALIDTEHVFEVSAATNQGVNALLQSLIALMPLGPRYYPVDQVSDMNMRFIAAEVVREKAIMHTEQEIPHAIAVEVVDYKEREEDNRTDIYATINVEKDSQKGIVIGKRGRMIKKIGVDARAELEKMLGRQVYLDLHVKVLKNWRSNEEFMKRVGYHMPKDDD